jgi:glycosyltransferase involved in cell wall biosynthesis
MEISIIIATYNRGEKLARTLRSLAAQTLPPDEWEAIVVNNNSTDDTAEVFAHFAVSADRLNIRTVDEARQGLSWARNRGIAEARGEIVVMIDDDEEACPEFLAAYCDFFAAHPEAAAAGGPMVACYEEERPPWMSHYTERLAASTIDLGERVRQFPRGRYPIGGNMAFRREVFDRVGVFDTSLGRTGAALLGGEEKDIFGRIAADVSARNSGGDGRKTGNEIWWVPEATVNHLIPPSRLTDAHFCRLSRMVGVTARTLSKGHYTRAVIAEAIKWCATLVLAAWFTLTLRPAKARYLIIMRREITRGLLCGNS